MNVIKRLRIETDYTKNELSIVFMIKFLLV